MARLLLRATWAIYLVILEEKSNVRYLATLSSPIRRWRFFLLSPPPLTSLNYRLSSCAVEASKEGNQGRNRAIRRRRREQSRAGRLEISLLPGGVSARHCEAGSSRSISPYYIYAVRRHVVVAWGSQQATGPGFLYAHTYCYFFPISSHSLYLFVSSTS